MEGFSWDTTGRWDPFGGLGRPRVWGPLRVLGSALWYGATPWYGLSWGSEVISGIFGATAGVWGHPGTWGHPGSRDISGCWGNSWASGTTWGDWITTGCGANLGGWDYQGVLVSSQSAGSPHGWGVHTEGLGTLQGTVSLQGTKPPSGAAPEAPGPMGGTGIPTAHCKRGRGSLCSDWLQPSASRIPFVLIGWHQKDILEL